MIHVRRMITRLKYSWSVLKLACAVVFATNVFLLLRLISRENIVYFLDNQKASAAVRHLVNHPLAHLISSQDSLHEVEKCIQPKLSLEHDALSFAFESLPPLNCSGPNFFYLQNGSLIRNTTSEFSRRLKKCEIYAIRRESDLNAYLEKLAEINGSSSVKINDDFVYVRCRFYNDGVDDRIRTRKEETINAESDTKLEIIPVQEKTIHDTQLDISQKDKVKLLGTAQVQDKLMLDSQLGKRQYNLEVQHEARPSTRQNSTGKIIYDTWPDTRQDKVKAIHYSQLGTVQTDKVKLTHDGQLKVEQEDKDKNFDQSDTKDADTPNSSYNNQLRMKHNTLLHDTYLNIKQDKIPYDTHLGMKQDKIPQNTQLGLKHDKILQDTQLSMKLDKLPQSTKLSTEQGKLPQGTRFGVKQRNLPQGTQSGVKQGNLPQGTQSGRKQGNLPQGTQSGMKQGNLPQGTQSGMKQGNLPQGTQSGMKQGNLPQNTQLNSKQNTFPNDAHLGGQKNKLPRDTQLNMKPDKIQEDTHLEARKSKVKIKRDTSRTEINNSSGRHLYSEVILKNHGSNVNQTQSNVVNQIFIIPKQNAKHITNTNMHFKGIQTVRSYQGFDTLNPYHGSDKVGPYQRSDTLRSNQGSKTVRSYQGFNTVNPYHGSDTVGPYQRSDTLRSNQGSKTMRSYQGSKDVNSTSDEGRNDVGAHQELDHSKSVGEMSEALVPFKKTLNSSGGFQLFSQIKDRDLSNSLAGPNAVDVEQGHLSFTNASHTVVGKEMERDESIDDSLPSIDEEKYGEFGREREDLEDLDQQGSDERFRNFNRDQDEMYHGWEDAEFEEKYLEMPACVEEQFLVQVTPMKHVFERYRNIKAAAASASADLNVLMFGIDSMSSMTFQRKLPDSLNFLKKDLDAVIFEGYNIVGDATTQALLPMFLGQLQHEIPDILERHLDGLDFVWKRYRERGYVTLFAEDEPHLGVFNLRLQGFQELPTDHYMRYFWQSQAQSHLKSDCSAKYCTGPTPNHHYLLQYITDFFHKYPRIPHFAVGFSGELSHDEVNPSQYLDPDLLTFLTHFKAEGYLNNTLLILFGDHGSRKGMLRRTLQGKIEERLPFMSMVFPESFRKKHRALYENLKRNAKGLTTPFDIHKTLLDVLDLPKVYQASEQKPERGVSLFRSIPENRTCHQAGVDTHWCTCVQEVPIPTSDPVATAAAQAVVDTINNLTQANRQQCALLQLASIHSASLVLPNLQVLTFHKTEGGNFSALFGNATVDMAEFQITLETDKCRGVFEATVQVLFHQDGSENGGENQGHAGLTYSAFEHSISRIDTYGSQPACICKSNPNIMKYCCCERYLHGEQMTNC